MFGSYLWLYRNNTYKYDIKPSPGTFVVQILTAPSDAAAITIHKSIKGGY